MGRRTGFSMMNPLRISALALALIATLSPAPSFAGYGHKGKLSGKGFSSSSSGGADHFPGFSSSSSGGSLLGYGKPHKKIKFGKAIHLPPVKLGGVFGHGRPKVTYGKPIIKPALAYDGLGLGSYLKPQKLKGPYRFPNAVYGDWNPLPGGCCGQAPWLPLPPKGGKEAKTIVINLKSKGEGSKVTKNYNVDSSVESNPSVKSEPKINIGEADVSSGEINIDDSHELNVGVHFNIEDEVVISKPSPGYAPPKPTQAYIPPPPPTYAPRPPPSYAPKPVQTYTPKPEPLFYPPKPSNNYAPKPPTYAPPPPKPLPRPTYAPPPPPPQRYEPKPVQQYSRPPPPPPPQRYEPRPAPTYPPPPPPPQPKYEPQHQQQVHPLPCADSSSSSSSEEKAQAIPPVQYKPSPPPVPAKVKYDIPRPNYVEVVEYQPQRPQYVQVVDYTPPKPKLEYKKPAPAPYRPPARPYQQKQKSESYASSYFKPQPPKSYAFQTAQVSTQIFGGGFNRQKEVKSYNGGYKKQQLSSQSYGGAYVKATPRPYVEPARPAVNQVQYWGYQGGKQEVREEQEEYPEVDNYVEVVEERPKQRPTYVEIVEERPQPRPVVYEEQRPAYVEVELPRPKPTYAPPPPPPPRPTYAPPPPPPRPTYAPPRPTYAPPSPPPRPTYTPEQPKPQYIPANQEVIEVQVGGSYGIPEGPREESPEEPEGEQLLSNYEETPAPPPPPRPAPKPQRPVYQQPAFVEFNLGGYSREVEERRPEPRPQYIERPEPRPQYIERPEPRPQYIERPEQRPVLQYVEQRPEPRPAVVEQYFEISQPRPVEYERPEPRPVEYIERPEPRPVEYIERPEPRPVEYIERPEPRPVEYVVEQQVSSEEHPIGLVEYKEQSEEQVYERPEEPATRRPYIPPQPTYTTPRPPPQIVYTTAAPRPTPTFTIPPPSLRPAVYSTTARPYYTETQSNSYRETSEESPVLVSNNGEFGLKVQEQEQGNYVFTTTTPRPAPVQEIEEEEEEQAGGVLLPQAAVEQRPVSNSYINRFPEAAAPEDFPVDSSEQGIIENNIVELRKISK